MDDPLKQFAGQDLSGAIQSLTVVEAKAKQTGNPYTCLQLTFINGFSTRIFLDSGSKFAVTQAINNI